MNIARNSYSFVERKVKLMKDILKLFGLGMVIGAGVRIGEGYIAPKAIELIQNHTKKPEKAEVKEETSTEEA